MEYIKFQMKITLWKITVCIMLIMALWAQALEQENDDQSTMMTNQVINGVLDSSTDFKSVNLVKIDQIKGRYLFFIMNTLESAWQNKKMGIFRYTELQTPLLVCKQTGVDACYIEASKFTLNEILVVGLTCEDKCSYQFSTYWSDIEIISPGETHKFIFQTKGKAQIYHVNLDKKKDFKELRIIAKPTTHKNSADSIKLYGNKGLQFTDPSIENHQFRSIGLLNGGEGIFFTKQDLNGLYSISLMIAGQTHNVYQLNCQLITQFQEGLILNNNIYSYLEDNSQKVFKIDFTQYNGDNVNYYELKLSKIQGDVSVKFFKDKSLKEKYTVQAFEYMKDVKYLFDKESLNIEGTKQIFMQIGTMGKNALTAVEFRTQLIPNVIPLVENTYDFIILKGKKILGIDFKEFIDGQENLPYTELNVNVIKVMGQLVIEFRYCKYDISQCLSLTQYQKSSLAIKPVNSGTVGMKNTYKLQIADIDLKVINEYQKVGLVLVVVSGTKENQASLLAVDYSYAGSIRDLREDHPIEQIIDSHEIKHYRFSITDPAVKEVRVHVYQISGGIKVLGTRQDPRVIKNIQGSVAIGNIVVFDKDFKDPMYVIVEGTTVSSFAITVQIIRKGDLQQINTLSISEDVSYTLRLKPQGSQILKTHPIFDDVFFKFRSAAGSVGVCVLGKDNKCQEQRPLVGKVGELKITEIKERTPQIVIGNPSSDKYLEVVVSYNSARYQKCQVVKINQFYSQTITHRDCFNIQLKDPIETIGVLAQRVDIGQLSLKIYACYEIINIQWPLPRFLVPAELIEKNCKGKNRSDRILSIMFQGDEMKEKEQMKVQFTAQYKDGVINLLDGISYRIDGQNTEGIIKTFYYKLVNIIDTRIILRGYRGNFIFYTKVIEHGDRETAVVDHKNFQFMSQTANIFHHPTLVLGKQDYMRSKCEVCGLLIAVQSNSPIGQHLDFSLEVVQNNIVIPDNKMVQTHLVKNSLAFYQYESHKDKDCNLIVQLSDHNKNCAKIYLSDVETADQSNFIAKEDGTKLTYSGCKKGHYYITVEAIEDCPYSISVANSAYSIVKAERGHPVNIKLQQGQIKYVIFRHIIKSTFKLVTMQKFGTVKIFADALTQDNLQQLTNGLAVTANFNFKSNFSNILTIRPSQPGFCTDCYYLAVVYCEKQTEASIILTDEETAITLSQQKTLNDQLFYRQSSNLTFSGVLAGSLSINIYNGDIKVIMIYQNQATKKVYNKSLQSQSFEFLYNTNLNDKYEWQPIAVNVECLSQSCIYSMLLVDTTNTKIEAMKIPVVAGKPTFVSLQKKSTKCLSGYSKDHDDELIITVDRAKIQVLSVIDIKVSIGGKETIEFVKNVISNVMTISFVREKPQVQATLPYEVCIISKSEDQISFVIDQGEDVNLLAQDLERVVRQQETFVIYPQGSFIVDVFQCQGPTTFKHSVIQDDLDHEEDLNGLDVVGMAEQTHAIKLTSYLPTFLRVKSSIAIIRWLPIDEQKEKGIGYMKYKSGNLKYQTSDNHIEFLWGGLSQISKTKTEASQISYRIYISNDEKHLKSASQCERFLNEDIITIEANIPKDKFMNAELSYKINKEDLLKKFKNQNIYVTIVADLSLSIPSQTPLPVIQYYRFIYQQQQIPIDVFSGLKSKNQKFIIIIIMIVASVLGVLILAYVFIKKIVPMIGRIRNRAMLEGEPLDSKASKGTVQEHPIQSNERIIVDLN